MRRLLPIIVTLALTLWLGGLVTLLLSVQTLFAAFKPDSTTAGFAAASLFHAFERYRLVLAGVLVVAIIAWRLLACSRARKILLVLVVLGAVAAVSSTAFVTPRIQALRVEDRTKTPEFRRLHGISSGIYLFETACLLVAACFLPSAIAEDGAVFRPDARRPISPGATTV